MSMGILVAAGADAERLLRPYPPADSHSEPRRLGLAVSPPLAPPVNGAAAPPTAGC